MTLVGGIISIIMFTHVYVIGSSLSLSLLSPVLVVVKTASVDSHESLVGCEYQILLGWDMAFCYGSIGSPCSGLLTGASAVATAYPSMYPGWTVNHCWMAELRL